MSPHGGVIKSTWTLPEVLRIGHGSDHDKTQSLRPWTPPPEPYEESTYRAWGIKHYGVEWDEDREEMVNNRDMYAFRDNVQGDVLFLIRQERLRRLERQKSLPRLERPCKPWHELIRWARWFYGEGYLDQLASVAEDMKSPHERVVQNAKTRARRLLEATWDRHEDVLAAGYSWDEIMAWPRTVSRLEGRTKGAIDFYRIGPKADDVWDSNDTSNGSHKDDKDDIDDKDDKDDESRKKADLRRMAIAGPQHNRVYALELRTIQNVDNLSIVDLFYTYSYSNDLLDMAARHKRMVAEEALAQARNTDALHTVVLNQHPVVVDTYAVLPEDPYVLHETNLKERHDRNMATLRAMLDSPPTLRLGPGDVKSDMYARWAVQGIPADEAHHLMWDVYMCPDARHSGPPSPPRHNLIFPTSLAAPKVYSRVWPNNEAEYKKLIRGWEGVLNEKEKSLLKKLYCTDFVRGTETRFLGEKGEKEAVGEEVVGEEGPSGTRRKAGKGLAGVPSTRATRASQRQASPAPASVKRVRRT